MKHIPELDGLRALAILLVIAWHFLGIPAGSGTLLWRFFYLGHFGVDLFFVLSGFLIGSILLASRGQPGFFANFYARRVLRIWPLYAIMVSVFIVGSAAGVMPALFGGAIPAWPYLFMIQNFWMVPMATYGAFFLAGTWSLCIEEQFYTVFPWLVAKLDLRQLEKVLWGAIIGCPILRIALAATGDGWAYYVLPFCRADVLAIGVLVAMRRGLDLVSARRVLLWTGLCVPLVILTHSSGSSAAVWQHTVAGLFFGSLLIVVLRDQNASLRVLRGPVAAFFARTSYCAYLIHHVVAVLIFRAFPVPVYTLPWLFLTAVAFGGTFLIATASYRWIERPLIERGRSLSWGFASKAAARG